VDPKTELACQHGTFVAAPCKGSSGCTQDANHLYCDFTGNATGDPCSTDDEGNAKCIGVDKRITCRSGKYFVDSCLGDEGCKAAGSIRCDQSKGEDGAPCTGKTNACTTDGKRVLECRDGRFVTTATCPGEGGCSIFDHKVDCDLGKKDASKHPK
jgi:hypothetical protein